jgi:hypothetical protein
MTGHLSSRRSFLHAAGLGKTLAEAQAAKPSAAFDAAWGKGMLPPDDFVALVYNTLR